MLLWLVYALFFLPATLKQNLLWLFLWQNREYRYDKMADYLSLKESKKVVFDSWSKMRIFVILLNILLIIVPASNNILIGGILAILFLSAFESVVYLDKVIVRKIKLPEFSAKAGLIFVISFLSSVAIPAFLFYYLTDVDLHLSVSNLLSLILWTNITLFFIPFIMGYWILMVFPFDLYAKNRLFGQARKYRESLKNLKTIAISGAFGKTTTKEILSYLLGSKYKVEKILKNQNSNVSCARRTLKLKDTTEFFICELGAYKRGDGNEICEFIEPDSSIITGLNHQHFSLFGSEANIILAESESLNFLRQGNIAIVNWSSLLCHKINFPNGIKLIKCGIEGAHIKNSKEIQYLAKKLETSFEGNSFELHIHSEDNLEVLDLKTQLIGAGAVQNIIHAVAYCLEHKLLDIIEIQRLIETMPEIEGRMQTITRDWGKIVYNQYNNPDGVINALDLFKTYPHKKLAILDDLLELGKKSKEIHVKVAHQLFESEPDSVVLLGRNFGSDIKAELIRLGYPEKKIQMLVGKNYIKLKKLIKTNLSKHTNSLVLLMGFQSKEFLDL